MNKYLVLAGFALLLLSLVSAQATATPQADADGFFDDTSWLFVWIIVLGVIAYFTAGFARFALKFAVAGAIILFVLHLLGLF